MATPPEIEAALVAMRTPFAAPRGGRVADPLARRLAEPAP
jgi:hypothetical protein